MSVTYLDQLSTETSPLSSDKLLGVRGTGVGSERLFSIGDLAEANLAQATIIATEIANEAADAAVAGLNTKGGFFYPEDFGPLSATLPISHTAIQAAIDAAYAAGGGTVVLPKGQLMIGASITLRSGVSVRGVKPKAPTALGDQFWEMRFSHVYSMKGAYAGGTVLIGAPEIEAFTHAGDNYLTGVELSHFGTDGLRCAFRVGATDHYGAAWCHFHHIVVMNNVGGYAFNVINSQQCRLEFLFALACDGFLAWQSLYDTGSPRPSGSSGNSSITHCMSESAPAGDLTPPIYFNADGGPVASLFIDCIQSNRLQVSSSANTVPVMWIRGRDRTTSVCQSIALKTVDLEGFCSNLLLCEYAQMVDISLNAVDTGNPTGKHVKIVESDGLWRAAIAVTVHWDGKYNNVWAGMAQSFEGAKMPGAYFLNSESAFKMVGIASGANTWAELSLDWGTLDLTKGVGLSVKERTIERDTVATLDKFNSGTVRCTGTASYTITMPAPDQVTGLPYRFIKEGESGTVTVDAALLGGATSFTLSAQKQWVNIRSNGTAYVCEGMGTATI